MLFGLMRLTIRQLHQQHHQVIVIGDTSDAKQCENQGIPVLGSCGGFLNASKTLQKRLCDYLTYHSTFYSEKMMVWGWHAMSVTTESSLEFDTYAVVDEIDLSIPCNGKHTVIPTSTVAQQFAKRQGVSFANITDPVVGIEPTSLIFDRETVLKSLTLNGKGLLVCIVGDVGSWQEIINITVRLAATNSEATLVIPPTFRNRTRLMRAAHKHGISHMIKVTPLDLRQIDVLRAADCAWCPTISSFDNSSNVLDVLCAAWELTPLAVHKNHPINTIPTIGSQIAWASDGIEVCGWMLDLKTNHERVEKICTDRVATVRSITAPSRFIETLQMRMHTLV